MTLIKDATLLSTEVEEHEVELDPHPQYATNTDLSSKENSGVAANLVANHEADTTSVHGIADTSALVLTGDSRLSNSRTPTGAASGDLAGSYPGPSVAARAITWAKTQAIATARILGRSTAGSGDVEELTGSQVAAILPSATTGVRGVVTPNGNTNNFLRGDGAFATPATGGGTVWLKGSTFPTAGQGVDGDFYIFQPDVGTYSPALFRKVSGSWITWGVLSGTWQDSYASAYGFARYPTFMLGPLLTNSVWQLSGLAAQTGQAVDFAGSSSGAYARYQLLLGSASAFCQFTITTMPVGANVTFGIGSFYGFAYPSVTISPSGVGTLLATSDTIPVTFAAGDVVSMGYAHGFGVISVTRANVTLWSGTVSGYFFTRSWTNDYGIGCNISSNGIMTAGKISMSNVEFGAV